MKILLVSYYFPPANVIGAVRVGKLAKYLHSRGHDVRVIAGQDASLPQNLPLEIPQELITYIRPLSLGIPRRVVRNLESRVRSGEARISPVMRWLIRAYKSLLHIPDAQIGWLPGTIVAGQRLIADWRPDVIYASAQPYTALLAGRALSKAFKVPWVAELRDLWVDNHYYELPWWRRQLDEALERFCLRSADQMVTVSEPLAEILRKKYRKPVTTVLNGFDPADYPSVTECHTDTEGVITIVYTGLVYPNRRDPTPLFAALKELGADARHFRVKFYGRLLSEVLLQARAYGIEDIVEAHPQVSYRESLAIQSAADVLLLLLWNSPEEKGVFTGKLFEYLGARRPILAIGPDDNVAAELIRARQAGDVLTKPDGIVRFLRRCLKEKHKAGYIAPLSSCVGEGFSRDEQFSGLEDRVLTQFSQRPANGIASILVVCNKLDVGGTERHLLQVFSRIDRNRFQICLFVLHPGGKLEKEMALAGVKVIRPRFNLPMPLDLVLAACLLGWNLMWRRPRIVHFFLPESYLVGGVVSLLVGPHVRIMSRRSLNEYQKKYPLFGKMERWLHGHMNAILGNSRAVADQLATEAPDQTKVGLLYNGVALPDLQELNRGEARESLGISPENFVIVIAANLIGYKGHSDLLDALALAAPRLPDDYILLCIGRDDGVGQELHEQAKRLGIEGHVRWLGEVEDPAPFLQAADIGVLCSHQEGFSNSLLEGMASGLPMIATRVGGNGEAVVHGKTGLLVSPHDPASLADAIVRLASDKALRLGFGEEARKSIEQRFSLDICVHGYERLYEALLDRAGEPVQQILDSGCKVS